MLLAGSAWLIKSVAVMVAGRVCGDTAQVRCRESVVPAVASASVNFYSNEFLLE